MDRIPLQVFGAEHYYEVHANWACSGASVFLPDGDIGGVVCLSGMAEHVNDHTLGMVVAAADAISRQLKLKDAYDQLSKSYRNLSAIIETVPTAMCLLDESLHVVAFNTQATRQLALAPAELSGADFLEVLGCGAVTAEDIKTSLSNRTISFERGEGKHTISLSVESTGHQEYVAQIEQLSSLHKRVNNIMGNEAHFRFQDIIGISPAMGRQCAWPRSPPRTTPRFSCPERAARARSSLPRPYITPAPVAGGPSSQSTAVHCLEPDRGRAVRL